MGSHGRQEATSPGDGGSATSMISLVEQSAECCWPDNRSHVGRAAGIWLSCGRFGPARRRCPELILGCAIAMLVPASIARQVPATPSGSSERDPSRVGWHVQLRLTHKRASRAQRALTHWVKTIEGRSGVRDDPGCAKTEPRLDGAGFQNQAHLILTGSATSVSEFQFRGGCRAEPAPTRQSSPTANVPAVLNERSLVVHQQGGTRSRPPLRPQKWPKQIRGSPWRSSGGNGITLAKRAPVVADDRL
jgi:hypothetical protein